MKFCTNEIDEMLKEKIQHGTQSYPIGYYLDDIINLDLGYIDWHWHNEVEIVIIKEGSVDCLFGSEKITLPKDWGVFINSKTIHRFETQNGGIMPNIVFSPELIAPEKNLVYKDNISPLLISGEPYLVLNPNIKWQQSVLELIDELFHIKNAETDPTTPLNTLIIITQLWKLLFQNMTISPNLKKSSNKTFQSPRLQTMLQFIHDNYMNNINLEDISKSINVSKSTALEVFRCGINQAPISYLIDYRIMQAAILLKNTKETVSYISLVTGFSNSSYFCKKFKNKFKITPMEYRKQF